MTENKGFTHQLLFQRLWTRFKAWLNQAKVLLVQGLVISLVLLALLILLSVIFQTYGYMPPVRVVKADPDYLGVLCPGDQLLIHNQVHVDAGVVAYFYISTTDTEGNANYPGTQFSYAGFTYLNEASFIQILPWEVPNLPHGAYLRVTAARGSDGREKPSFVKSSYIIGDQGDCKHEGLKNTRSRLGDFASYHWSAYQGECRSDRDVLTRWAFCCWGRGGGYLCSGKGSESWRPGA